MRTFAPTLVTLLAIALAGCESSRAPMAPSTDLAFARGASTTVALSGGIGAAAQAVRFKEDAVTGFLTISADPYVSALNMQSTHNAGAASCVLANQVTPESMKPVLHAYLVGTAGDALPRVWTKPTSVPDTLNYLHVSWNGNNHVRIQNGSTFGAPTVTRTGNVYTYSGGAVVIWSVQSQGNGNKPVTYAIECPNADVVNMTVVKP